MDKEKGNDYISDEIKVILLGAQGVGKSSLVICFTSKMFSQNTMLTVGGSYFTKSVKLKTGEVAQLNIWDTAGQEKFRTLNRIYYSGTSACVLVYDITSRESFQELKDFYAKEIKEKLYDDIILAVAGNKADLYEKGQVDEKEAKEFCEQIGAMFFSTSAKSAVGVFSLFETIVSKYFHHDSLSIKSRSRELSIKSFKTGSSQSSVNKKFGCCL